MAKKKTEDVRAEFLLDLIEAVDENERAALDAIGRFVETVDQSLPGGGKKGSPSHRVEVVEAALKMIEQLLGVSNDVARRLTASVRQALPEIERNAKAAARRASTTRPAKKATAKKTPAKKTTAKKAPAKTTAKKTTAKKTTAKKASAKKTPAKRS